jgi:hypothetical protein
MPTVSKRKDNKVLFKKQQEASSPVVAAAPVVAASPVLDEEDPPANIGELLVHATLKLAFEDNRPAALELIANYSFDFKSQRDREQQVNFVKMLAGRLSSSSAIIMDKILEGVAERGQVK